MCLDWACFSFLNGTIMIMGLSFVLFLAHVGFRMLSKGVGKIFFFFLKPKTNIVHAIFKELESKNNASKAGCGDCSSYTTLSSMWQA